MDKGKKQIPKKLKTSEIIIFTPQELVDLGILQNIHQVQKSPDVKSKANKKRIIEVIQKSLNASKEQPSTSKSSQPFPIVDSQELKRNLMDKLSAASSTNVNVSKKGSEGPKTPVKVLNSDISIPKIPLTNRGRTKTANSGILLPSSVNKKLKKKTQNTTSLTKNTSILIKDVRIKEIIMSAVRSNSKEGFPSHTSVETKLPESESSTILAKSPTTPGAEETTGYYNIKETNTDIEGKSTQEKSEYKDIIQPDRSTKKQIRVVSNTQLSLTKEELKDLITPQMHSNNHELKTESQDLKNVEFMQTTSLKNKDSQILNRSTKTDEVTDGVTSARPSLPMKDLESKISIQRNCEKSKCYYNKRKYDGKETELNLTNVTQSENIDREIEKSNFHDNAKHKLGAIADNNHLISSNSNTAELSGSNDICNKNIDEFTREMHTIQKDCSSEISSQVLDKRNEAKEGVDLRLKRNVSNTKLPTASSSSMTQNEDMLLEKDISDCCSNEETQEKSVEIIVDAEEVCESQKSEEFLNDHLLPNELTNDDIIILEEPKQCQSLKISSEELESSTTIKSLEGNCELLGKADLLNKSKNDKMDILDKNSDICKKYISKKISQKAQETIKTISKSEAMMKSKDIGSSRKRKSTSEDIPISSVEIVTDNEVNLILDKELSIAGKSTNNPADSVLNVEPSSTQIVNSADGDNSFETSEVKHTFGGKKRLYDKTALKMLMDVSKKTKNAAKICETKNPSPSEPCDNESEQNPSTVITKNLPLEEIPVKAPKRRGRAPKNLLNTTQTTECLNVTNIATSTPKVQKQTIDKLGLSDKKTTTEILEKDFSVAGPSNISKQGISEIVLEINSEEIATSTSTKEHEKFDDTANSLSSHKKDNLKQKGPSEEQSDVPIITPKKRGRPRKNPLDPPKPKKTKVDYFKESISNSSLDNITDVEMDVSKSGRKRRKINYFDLENSFTDDTKIKNYSHIDEEKKPFKTNKRKMSFEGAIIQNSETSEIFDAKPNINDTVLKPQPAIAVAALKVKPNVSGEILEEKGKISANNISVEHLDTSQMTLTEENTDEDQQIKVKTKKYNKTGETQKMMQSIFSAAIKAVAPQNDNKEDVPGHQDNSEHQESPKPAVRYRGRPKKSQAGTSIVIDDEGKVKCCTCNTKVVNKEWQSHNRNVHYNLAWREGEQFVNVDNHVFVRKKLTPILQEDKSLVCSKCNKEFYVANEFILHREECLGIVKNSMVTCGICSEEIDQGKWMSHRKKKHNNLTWRVGDPPLDLNNQVLVLQVLNALYKAKIPLYCYKCRESKKSVIGFLSHQSQCGVDIENAKIPCPICGKRVLPVSMLTHNKFVHEPKPPKPDEENESIKGLLENGGVVNKRNAAKQAMKMIDIVSKSKLETVFAKEYVESPNLKEEEFVLKLLDAELKENDILKCKFATCDVVYKQWEQMVEHLDECTQKPEQYFVCKRCFAIFLLEEEVRNHVRDQHNINLRDDVDYEAIEGSDGENEEKFRQELLKIRRHQNQQVARNVHVKIKPRFLHRIPKAKNRLCTSAFEYTLEFYNEHYTESVLFDRLRYLKSDWTLVNDEFLDDCLPKIELSCHFTTKMVSSFDNMLKYDHEFSSLELFDVIEHEDGATLFCGGPVTAMSWLPTPHILLYCKQILAVAVSKDFESKYLLNTNYMEPCIIQFWDFGVLKKKIKPQKPKFLFGLAINYGPIWHMEWCPSGCYDEKVFNNDKLQRMGLLAVAGSVPTVNIYSIPFIKDEDNMHLIYQAKPLVRLKLFREYDNTKAKCFPTRISWSKASGHRYVAVGYSDGMVALFDIESTSDILKFTDDLGVDTILPYKTLKAHMYYISILSLIHLGGGTRYLLTGSFDRNVHVWDLTDNTSSLFARKKVLSDGTWLTNWIAFATTVDENTTNSGPATTCITSHRNYMYDITHMMGSPSSLTSLSSSDWLNGLLHGTSCGEILVTFPGQLLFGLDTDKRIKSLKWMLGYTKLINMSLTPEERIKEDEEEKKMTQSLPKTRDCDRDTAAYIFNQGDRLKKYQPHTYEKAVEKYGLVICDIKRKSFEEAPMFNLSDVLETSRPDLYPLQAINKVAFNPNSQSSLYFAAGYQAGFVRLRYMKFLENDKQVV